MITLTAAKKKFVIRPLIFATTLFFISFDIGAQTPNLIFAPVLSGLSSPCDVVNAGDGTNRLFIAQLGGNVRIVTLPGGTLLPGDFLDIPDSTDNVGEGGLLSIAFHPDYENNRYFFVYYTTNDGDLRLTRFQTQAGNPNAADENTGTVLLTIPHPTNSNHNGGKLNFGPDGNLYLGIGDGGSGDDPLNNAQNGAKLLGKMLRINVDNFTTSPYYSIPADNPYISNGAVLDEIYNIGLRNPWRWSFDRLNGDVWIADVGQDQREEVNYTPFASSAALNYGWRCYEGFATNDLSGCSMVPNYYFPPIFDYPRPLGHSVTGGYVYRGPDYHVLDGYYICADYVFQNAWLIKPDGMGGSISSIQSSGIPGSIVGFGEAENGALYALSLNGSLYKITSNTPYVPLTLLQFTGKVFGGYNELKWKTTNEQNLSHYEIQFSNDGVNYTNAGRVNAMNTTLENNYSFQHLLSSFTKLFYRLKSVDKDDSYTYSTILTLNSKDKADIRIYPTLIKGNNLNIISAKPVEQLSIFSAEGKTVFQTKLNNISGAINISIPRLPKGVYIVEVRSKDDYVYEKVLMQQE